MNALEVALYVLMIYMVYCSYEEIVDSFRLAKILNKTSDPTPKQIWDCMEKGAFVVYNILFLICVIGISRL